MRGPIQHQTPSDQVQSRFSRSSRLIFAFLNSTPGWVFFRGYKQH
jgi:hypothetical protein